MPRLPHSETGFMCGVCKSRDQIVLDSRQLSSNVRRRRRECQKCGKRSTYYEIPQMQYRNDGARLRRYMRLIGQVRRAIAEEP